MGYGNTLGAGEGGTFKGEDDSIAVELSNDSQGYRESTFEKPPNFGAKVCTREIRGSLPIGETTVIEENTSDSLVIIDDSGQPHTLQLEARNYDSRDDLAVELQSKLREIDGYQGNITVTCDEILHKIKIRSTKKIIFRWDLSTSKDKLGFKIIDEVNGGYTGKEQVLDPLHKLKGRSPWSDEHV